MTNKNVEKRLKDLKCSKIHALVLEDCAVLKLNFNIGCNHTFKKESNLWILIFKK